MKITKAMGEACLRVVANTYRRGDLLTAGEVLGECGLIESLDPRQPDEIFDLALCMCAAIAGVKP